MQYTGSPDAEGTLGGLVQQARHLEDHLAQALRMSALCSNDPVRAQHVPGESLESPKATLSAGMHPLDGQDCGQLAREFNGISRWFVFAGR